MPSQEDYDELREWMNIAMIRYQHHAYHLEFNEENYFNGLDGPYVALEVRCVSRGATTSRRVNIEDLFRPEPHQPRPFDRFMEVVEGQVTSWMDAESLPADVRISIREHCRRHGGFMPVMTPPQIRFSAPAEPESWWSQDAVAASPQITPEMLAHLREHQVQYSYAAHDGSGGTFQAHSFDDDEHVPNVNSAEKRRAKQAVEDLPPIF